MLCIIDIVQYINTHVRSVGNEYFYKYSSTSTLIIKVLEYLNNVQFNIVLG